MLLTEGGHPAQVRVYFCHMSSLTYIGLHAKRDNVLNLEFQKIETTQNLHLEINASLSNLLSINEKLPLLKFQYFENYKRNLDSYFTFLVSGQLQTRLEQ